MAKYDLFGLTASPYSVKMLALMRYRQLSFEWHLSMPHLGDSPLETPLPLIPVLAEHGQTSGRVDSTRLIDFLETQHRARSVVPDSPGLQFVSKLLEDFADEWLSKLMFFYRWGNSESAAYAKVWVGTEVCGPSNDEQLQAFANRQIDRMDLAGSRLSNGPVLEAEYQSLLGIWEQMIEQQPFCLGGLPSAGDFGFYGQLRQLSRDVLPRQIMLERAPLVLAWLNALDDGSGLRGSGWIDEDELASKSWFRELTALMGNSYARYMSANAAAVARGTDTVELELESGTFTQPALRYPAKCWQILGSLYAALSDSISSSLRELLVSAKCTGMRDTQP